jgi:predicted AlkP superfamily pyrophosphatase or phosphodiesterase
MRKLWMGPVTVLALLVGVGLGWFFVPSLPTARAEPASVTTWKKPKLAVLVVFDQFRGDYPARWERIYGEGGLKRLMVEGAWFTNCHYPYSDTLTAAGHASLSTGTTPSRHGIIANSWYDRKSAKVIESIDSMKYRPVPPPEKELPGPAPERRRVEAIGDVLLRVTNGKGKVASLSIKDRSAILLAAYRAQICYWFSTYVGQFVTSTYYSDRLAPWVDSFNKKKLQDQWLDKSWDRLRVDLDYAKHSGPDDFPGEGTGYEQGSTFPHAFSKTGKLDRTYYSAVTCSPAGNELLWELAKVCIEAERLGQGDETDMLCLSFSCNDIVGHAFGPDSQEVLDMTLRTDRLLKEMFEHFDARIGEGNWVFAMSADHGVCPLPEAARTQGKASGRVMIDELRDQASRHLEEKLGAGPWIEATAGGWYYLHRGNIKNQGKVQADVERELAGWLTTQKGVLRAYTRTELLAADIGKDDDPLLTQVRRSFHPEESGDVVLIPQPYHVPTTSGSSKKAGAYKTTHGSPHPYDTHVPLFVMGPGVKPGRRDERITPQAMATILPHAMGIPRPGFAEAPLPEGLFLNARD